MLKDVYPEYQDSVDFYALGIDPTEELGTLVGYKDGQGYPWPVSKAPAAMLPQYNVLGQPTKVAIDGDGVIVFREGYGVEPAETWHELFRELSQL